MRERRLPQQLCHYVGGNYESDENGEGERIGAKALTLEREGKLSFRDRSVLAIQIPTSSRRAGTVRRVHNMKGDWEAV